MHSHANFLNCAFQGLASLALHIEVYTYAFVCEYADETNTKRMRNEYETNSMVTRKVTHVKTLAAPIAMVLKEAQLLQGLKRSLSLHFGCMCFAFPCQQQTWHTTIQR